MITFLNFRVPRVKVQHTLDRFSRRVRLNWLTIKVLDNADYADLRQEFSQNSWKFPENSALYLFFLY